MNRELLEKPFEAGQVKQRVGIYGNVLDYIEGHSVITRLNEAFDGAWSFEILRHEILEEKGEVLVLGKLTAEGVVKCQFGSSHITKAKDSGEIISLADDLKSAGTDSLKKCASMLGVGLYLYGDKAQERLPQTAAPKTDQPQSTESKGGNGGHPGNGGNGGNGNNGEGGRISNRQYSFILDLGRKLDLTSNDLDQEALKDYGAKLAYLSTCQASAFIDTLKAMSV